jgi:hypothetical protein
MAIRGDDVPIVRPCPVDLPEEFAGGSRTRHCGHCDKTVHLLSSLTEREAQDFLAANAERDVCVTYQLGTDGQIVFRPDPRVVPLHSLMRRRAVAAASAAGLGLALAACTPVDNPRVDAAPVPTQIETRPAAEQRNETPARGLGDVLADAKKQAESEPPAPPAPPKEIEKDPPRLHAGKPVIRPPVVAAGGIGPMPTPPTPPPVGVATAESEEPCDPEDKPVVAPPTTMRKGGIRRAH